MDFKERQSARLKMAQRAMEDRKQNRIKHLQRLSDVVDGFAGTLPDEVANPARAAIKILVEQAVDLDRTLLATTRSLVKAETNNYMDQATLKRLTERIETLLRQVAALDSKVAAQDEQLVGQKCELAALERELGDQDRELIEKDDEYRIQTDLMASVMRENERLKMENKELKLKEMEDEKKLALANKIVTQQVDIITSLMRYFTEGIESLWSRANGTSPRQK